VVLQAVIPPTNPNIKFSGRTALSNGNVIFDWPGVQFSFTFTGPTCSLILTELHETTYYARTGSWLNIILDGHLVGIISLTGKTTTFPVISGINNDAHHLVVTKRTEPDSGIVSFGGIILSEGHNLVGPPVNFTRRIEFFGDSITCGFGNMGVSPCDFTPATEDNYNTYAVEIANHFNAEVYIQAWSGKGVVRNCCNQNITSPDPLPIYYKKTIANYASNDWNFKWIPDAVVINLGTNDYSTAPQPPENIFKNGYNSFLAQIRQSYSPAKPVFFLICGPMIGNPCCGYVKDVAAANDAHFIDLQSILENPFDYGCSGHPSISGHQKMASHAIPTIQQVMGWK